jgi:outer membrane protein assembly factor BamB
LVEQLGGDKAKARESAQRELIRIGEPAKPAVEAAKKSDDLEVRQRATAIAEEIVKNAFVAKTEAIARKILWRLPLPDHGVVGSPVVAGGVVYISGDDRLRGVDAKTGKEVWKSDEPGTFGPALAAGEAIVAHDCQTSNELRAFDAKGGKLWLATAGAEAAAGDGVVYAGEKHLAAIDAMSGKTRWLADVEGQCTGRPAVGDGRAYVLSATTQEPVKPKAAGVVIQGGGGVGGEAMTLWAFDAQTGKAAWKVPVGADAAGLAYHDGAAYVVGGGKLQAVAADDGKPLWQLDLPAGENSLLGIRGIVRINGRVISNMGSDDGPPVIADGVIYIVAGRQLVGVAAKTGKQQFMHRLELGSGEDPAGPPQVKNQIIQGGIVIQGQGALVAGNIIVGGGGGGRLVINGQAVNLDGGAPQAPEVTAPAIKDGVAYIGALNGLHAFDLATGKRLWYLKTANPVSGRPVIAGNVLYFGTASSGAVRPAITLAGVVAQANGPVVAPPIGQDEPKDPPGLFALDLTP